MLASALLYFGTCMKRTIVPLAVSVKQLHCVKSLKVGDFIKDTRSFSQEEVNQFALLSGDTNPVHIDPEFVKKVGFYERTIVHGAFVNAFVSSILGTKFPGPGSIAVSLTIRFPKPLYVGETIDAKVTVTDIKKRFIKCAVHCTVGEKTVYDGNATIWLKKPE